MIKIYFDQNIFTQLRKKEKKIYCDVLENLIKYEKYFLPIFSTAHFKDLGKKKGYTNDKQYRLTELQFIHQLTNGFHLAYHPIEKRINYYLVRKKNWNLL